MVLRLRERIVVSLSLEPVGTDDLAGSIEPIQAIGRQRETPRMRLAA
jgi:hypothetical protein